MKIVEFEGKKKSEAELMIEDANRMRREQDRARVFEAVALAIMSWPDTNDGCASTTGLPKMAAEFSEAILKARDEFAKKKEAPHETQD